MLVLSRNSGDGITFPDLDLVVEILKVQGKRVQLGISAADTIRVLRSELCEREREMDSKGTSQRTHSLRNELNSLSISLALAEKHLQRGNLQQAEEALENVFDRLKSKHGEEAPSVSSSLVREAAPVASVDKRDVRRGGKVLVVEDNANESRLLAEILSMHGFEVRTASDGIAAIAALEQETPDVILMDMHMSNCDGPTTVKRIRENPQLRSIPIFAVSGSDRREIQEEQQSEVEVQDWFQKPVKTQPLLSAIDDLVIQAMRF
jgi:carbon storage regulator CsrA